VRELTLKGVDPNFAPVYSGLATSAYHAEGLAELDTCHKRRGDATAVFLDDAPSFRLLAPLRYWLGRAQEGVGQRSAAKDNYAAFLALRPNSANDPLVRDARMRQERQ
jgi:hypothetical protein